MAGDFDYRNIDDVIHSRVRLAIMAYLMTAKTADFVEVKKQLKVSDGNLSTHLKKLEDTGYISVEKRFRERRPQTLLTLTSDGEKSFKAYLDELSAMVGLSDNK
jgi:DNA-binding MarR family transcriptional regulator